MFRTSNCVALLTMSAIFSTVIFCLSPVASGKSAKKEVTGKEYYQQYCASCHVMGGNLAKPTKPIAGSSELKSITTFQKYLENPPGHMPYFKSVVTNKKTLRKLYDYCRTLKKTESA
ncbi:MAG: cytochrome c [Candidatus Melainabacteria bacterium]|nr:cytochrome c [Candidatus Melainabacteria bacterium]